MSWSMCAELLLLKSPVRKSSPALEERGRGDGMPYVFVQHSPSTPKVLRKLRFSALSSLPGISHIVDFSV